MTVSANGGKVVDNFLIYILGKKRLISLIPVTYGGFFCYVSEKSASIEHIETVDEI
jgi:hypothetical protein